MLVHTPYSNFSPVPWSALASHSSNRLTMSGVRCFVQFPASPFRIKVPLALVLKRAFVACDYNKVIRNQLRSYCQDFVLAKGTSIISILFTDALFFILLKDRCSHRPGMSFSATGFPRNLLTLGRKSSKVMQRSNVLPNFQTSYFLMTLGKSLFISS
jgi:hypothetical protein